jgi:hypothetical protein
MNHKPVQATPQKTWGIIRYAPGSGLFCDEDAAAFDGAIREWALAIAKGWATEHPEWVVALVASDQIWFGDRDFAGARGRPLTVREAEFERR